MTSSPVTKAPAGIVSVARIGDCEAPGAIVHATYAGHRYARELDVEPHDLADYDALGEREDDDDDQG